MSQMSHGKLDTRIVKISLKYFSVLQIIFLRNLTYFKETFFKGTCCRYWVVFCRIVCFTKRKSCSFNINNILFVVNFMEEYFSFIPTKVVLLMLNLCHLFPALLPKDFYSGIPDVKKKTSEICKVLVC